MVPKVPSAARVPKVFGDPERLERAGGAGTAETIGTGAQITRADIVAEARTWIGTPWKHQGRLKGVACDCVGVIICVPRALGLFPADFDIANYPRNPEPRALIANLNRHMDRIDGAFQPGDVLLLRPHRITQHVGLVTSENSLIHAIDRQRGVREHSIDERWRRAICGVWRYRGVQ